MKVAAHTIWKRRGEIKISKVASCRTGGKVGNGFIYRVRDLSLANYKVPLV